MFRSELTLYRNASFWERVFVTNWFLSCRIAWKQIARAVGWAPVFLALLASSVALVQEPLFLRTYGLELYWDLCLMIALFLGFAIHTQTMASFRASGSVPDPVSPYSIPFGSPVAVASLAHAIAITTLVVFLFTVISILKRAPVALQSWPTWAAVQILTAPLALMLPAAIQASRPVCAALWVATIALALWSAPIPLSSATATFTPAIATLVGAGLIGTALTRRAEV